MEIFTSRINWQKIIFLSLIFTVISTAIHTIESFLTMSYYINPENFALWSKLMMPAAGPPPTGFYLMSLVSSFITGVVLVLFYYLAKNFLPNKTLEKVVFFALLMFSLMAVFTYMPMFLLLNIPGGLLASWLFSSALIMFITSAIFVKLER